MSITLLHITCHSVWQQIMRDQGRWRHPPLFPGLGLVLPSVIGDTPSSLDQLVILCAAILFETMNNYQRSWTNWCPTRGSRVALQTFGAKNHDLVGFIVPTHQPCGVCVCACVCGCVCLPARVVGLHRKCSSFGSIRYWHGYRQIFGHKLKVYVMLANWFFYGKQT